MGAGGTVAASEADLFRDCAVVVKKSQARDRMGIFDFAAGQWRAIVFPEPVYATSPNGTPDTPHGCAPGDAPSVFNYDTAGGRATLLRRQETPGGYDPGAHVSERLWVTARDGTKVPLSVVYRKGFRRNGTAPLFLYAHGSHGIGTPASFSSQRGSPLDRGMAVAIAHVRGGGDMGEPCAKTACS